MGRNDAKRVYDIPTLNQIYPYMMRRRCDSLVYQTVDVDLTEVMRFIKEKKRNERKSYRIFEIMVASILRTIALRPELNRFIASRCYWQRNELSFNFIIKEDYTDSAPEHSKPLLIRPDMNLDEITEIIREDIKEGRTPQKEGFTDRTVAFFLHFPRWFIGSFVNIAGFLDRHGHAPAALREVDGLHSTIFISNLGSIGLGGTSPHHHLYEWGTTSLFMTIGMLNRKRMDDGTLKYLIEIGFTIDERITDGWYFTQSLKLFQHLLAHPEELMENPKLPPPLLTKKQVRTICKQKRRQAKESLKATLKEDGE